VVIVSSDKDMMQLVTERVSMLNPAKDDAWYTPEKVKEFLGAAGAGGDLLALKGDAVDNIPGAPGIGEKGAKDLIERFGSAKGRWNTPRKWSGRRTGRASRTTSNKCAEQAAGHHFD